MQANTAPVAFWAAAFLLLPRHRRHREALLSGLLSDPACSPADSKAAGGGGGGGAAGWKRRLLAQAADRRSLLARCSSEALRLRSVVSRSASPRAQVMWTSGVFNPRPSPQTRCLHR
jgi:hypothetical protein